MFVIQRRTWDALTMNSQNHPKEEGDVDAHARDYEAEVRKMHVAHWRALIQYPVAFEYTLERREIKQLIEAMRVSIQTGTFSAVYEEEMDEIVDRLGKAGLPPTTTGWFFRFDECSPKDGAFAHHWDMIRGAEDVVRQLVTSNRARLALESGNTMLYFCHVDPRWDYQREVRVFVHKGMVTAISQYAHDSTWFCARTDAQLEALGLKIVQKLTAMMRDIVFALNTQSFICDILVKDDVGEDLHLIEFNPCGYWLPGGSAFYHWMHDRRLLYNDEGTVYFRVGTL